LQNKAHGKYKKDRNAYLSHFPKLSRHERNARTDPFEVSKGVNYGTGVRLYSKYDTGL
jgi:hypothetical protein